MKYSNYVMFTMASLTGSYICTYCTCKQTKKKSFFLQEKGDKKKEDKEKKAAGVVSWHSDCFIDLI